MTSIRLKALLPFAALLATAVSAAPAAPAAPVGPPEALAQDPTRTVPEGPDPADVASVDAIIAALYDVISGPAGQERDWERFHHLFAQGARLIPTGVAPDGTARHQVMTPAEYVERSGPVLVERGFFESEIGRVTEEFGAVTHAFSAYDSRWRAEDPEPFARGINSIQLFDDGERWWIVSVFWAAERDDLTIPAKYLNR